MKRLVCWTARILAIAAILFISVFALDVFQPGKPWHDLAVGLVMHLLPSVVLTAILVLAWRVEWLGGALFIAAGLSPFLLLANPKWINLMLGAPFLLSGLLFLASYRLNKKGHTGVQSP